MSVVLVLEQSLNAVQLGITLFLIAAGLTLSFGTMGLINLAHGSLYMAGAYVAASSFLITNNFSFSILIAAVFSGILGIIIEVLIMKRLYRRDHLDQVLATFGLIIFFNALVKIIWGSQALFFETPDWLSGSIVLYENFLYPEYRLALVAAGFLVSASLWVLIVKTRTGMLIRAGSSNPKTVEALGINIERLFTFTFGLGAFLAGLAGALAAPLIAIQIGMGEDILIMCFVIIVVGGIGSIRGAFIGAILIGLADTFGRAILPSVLDLFLSTESASRIGSSISDVAIYLLMIVILICFPQGLFKTENDS